MTATSFHNSCLNMESGTVEVFCETGDVCESGEYCHSRHDTMPCSVTTSPMPDSFFVDKEGIYLFAASDVPTSSLQSLSFLFHLASHVGSFPAIRRLLEFIAGECAEPAPGDGSIPHPLERGAETAGRQRVLPESGDDDDGE